jgi:hypothetical protein
MSSIVNCSGKDKHWYREEQSLSIYLALYSIPVFQFIVNVIASCKPAVQSKARKIQSLRLMQPQENSYI